MKRLIYSVTAIVVAYAFAASAQAAVPYPACKQHTAKARERCLRANRAQWIESRRHLIVQVGTLKQNYAALSASARQQIATLTMQSSTLTAQRDQALSGLSGAISVFVRNATTATEVYNGVLAPARAAWTCGGTTFFGTSLISVDFYRTGYCS